VPDTWRWVHDDDPSDLDLNPLFDRRCLRYPEASGPFVVSADFGDTASGSFYTPLGQPGSHDWPAGKPWRVAIYVHVANADITLNVGLERVSSAGAFVEAYDNGASTIGLGTTGVHEFSGLTRAQSAAPAPSPSDRIRVRLSFTHNGAKGSTEVTLGFGDETRDLTEVPIVMGDPRITWNGNALDFPGRLTAYRKRLRTDREFGRSGGGVAATQMHHRFYEVMAEVNNFDSRAFYNDLVAFWSWASRGKQFAFALDSAKVVDLVLNGAAAAGQKDIPLADTSSVVVGETYLLREAAGDELEIIEVASITANVKAVAVNNLKYGYLTGDVFRSPDYFPKMVTPDADLPAEEIITTFALGPLNMIEDRG
jgi:hypothetical protein